jgi:uncharacterized protein (DUF305 family)
MFSKKIAALAALLVLAAGAFALTACGDDDTSGTSDAQETDGAFIAEMIPHHQSAIAMAKIAQKQAEHPEVTQLADDIVAAQDSEIEDMDAMHERMFGESAMGADHGDLGLDDHMMGMDSMSMDSLAKAKPFDEAFIDEMIPHHQGAIRMARIELQKGQNGKLRDIAEEVVSAQAREIRAMNKFRVARYGAPSPAGGVPAAGDSTSGMDMEHHGG